jgi:bifunctional non-homologous end joining protein LigD
MIARLPPGFIKPCLPMKAERAPTGPAWVHEINHDGYRLMVDGDRTRCYTRNGHHWADRFPSIVAAAHRINATSFLIDGEAVIARDDGTSDFCALRSRRPGYDAVLYAFDLIEHDGEVIRSLPLVERKRRLAKLIGKAKHAIQFVEPSPTTAPPSSSTSAAGAWKASFRSGLMGPTAAGHHGRGSR